MTLNGVMGVILRYLTEFGKHAFQHNRVDLWRNLCTSLLYFVVCVRCRCKESSRSLSHLLMSFLSFHLIMLHLIFSLFYHLLISPSMQIFQLTAKTTFLTWSLLLQTPLLSHLYPSHSALHLIISLFSLN